MSKIVIDARLIQTSTGRYIEQLLRHLEDIDNTNQYQILVYEKEKNYYKPHNPNFEVLVADFKHYTFAEQLGFCRFLNKLDADLVHFHMPQQPLLYTKPAVTTVHDLSLVYITSKDVDMGLVERHVKRAIFASLLWVVAHRAKCIITPTNYTKNDLVKFAHISASKVAVTLEGVTKVKGVKEMPQFKNKKFLVFLGQSGSHKNNRGLIEAHQKLVNRYPDLNLVIGGKIDELREADMEWVKQNKFKNIHFTGWLDDQEAVWLYKNAQAFVWPTFREGIGLPPLEAMTQGCPVVSTNTTCSPEVNGNAAHYFDPYDKDDIVRAIDEVLTDDKLRNKLIKNGYEQVKKYSWPRVAKQTLGIYKDILGQ